MTDKAKNFIYLLEKEKAPIQEGYYYFDSGIFSNPAWYRLNNRISQWQITFDLVKWYNVTLPTLRQGFDSLTPHHTIRSLVKWISFWSSKPAVGVRSSQDRP